MNVGVVAQQSGLKWLADGNEYVTGLVQKNLTGLVKVGTCKARVQLACFYVKDGTPQDRNNI
jgi:hypothetical protein